MYIFIVICLVVCLTAVLKIHIDGKREWAEISKELNEFYRHRCEAE